MVSNWPAALLLPRRSTQQADIKKDIKKRTLKKEGLKGQGATVTHPLALATGATLSCDCDGDGTMNKHDSDRATGSRAWLLTTRGTEYMVALLVAKGMERNRSDLSVEEQDLLGNPLLRRRDL